MLQIDKIVRNVLRQLGEVQVYNDNKSEIYNYVKDILGDVLDHVATRDDLKFNSITAKLTKSGKDEDTGENRFNLPIDFMNKIQFIGAYARIEGEFVYSTEDELILRYCRTIAIHEYPDYMEHAVMLMTAVRVAESYSTYQDRLELLNVRLTEEINRIYNLEFEPRIRTY